MRRGGHACAIRHLQAGRLSRRPARSTDNHREMVYSKSFVTFRLA